MITDLRVSPDLRRGVMGEQRQTDRPRGGEQTERHFPYIDSESFRRDSEMGQMLMACGKLLNQVPAVKMRLSSSGCSSQAAVLRLQFLGCSSQAAVLRPQFSGCSSQAAVLRLQFSGCSSLVAVLRL